MKNRIIITALILSAVGIIFSSNFSKAASINQSNEAARCAIRSLKDAFSNSEAVFSGKVLSVKKNGDTKTFEFKVEKYWKGAKAKKIKINVYETPRYQAFFEVGEKYLVFAEITEDGELRNVRCSRTRALSAAAEDLNSLGKGKIPR